MTGECNAALDCHEQFSTINRKLDKLDEAIRGNGHPGILMRLDRLERSEIARGRMFWIVTGSAAALILKSVMTPFLGG